MVDVMILFGSGGHSTEMHMLLQNAKLSRMLDHQINRLICVISDDDHLIENKINKEFTSENKHKLETVRFRRSRRIGQSSLSAIWTTLLGLISSIKLILSYKPKLCITNGPAISVTISLAIRFLEIITFGYYRCEIIFIESFCRTKTLSLSGKIIYYMRLANKFYIQWPGLNLPYPRTIYKGFLV